VGPESARLELDADDALFDGVLAAQAFAARAEMDVRCGDDPAARADYAEALARETDAAARRYLQRRLEALG
jgi:predicted RNA polymerase sigma factor